MAWCEEQKSWEACDWKSVPSAIQHGTLRSARARGMQKHSDLTVKCRLGFHPFFPALPSLCVASKRLQGAGEKRDRYQEDAFRAGNFISMKHQDSPFLPAAK